VFVDSIRNTRASVWTSPLTQTAGPATPAPTAAAQPDAPADKMGPIASGHVLRHENGLTLQIPQGEAVSIGRQEEATMRLDSTQVSRRHAEVKYDGGVVQLRDVGSTNGTTVNGVRLEPMKWYSLPSASTVRFGDVDFKLGAEQGGGNARAALQTGAQTALAAAQGAPGGWAGFLLGDTPLKQNGTYAVGREESNAVRLLDSSVSRKHGEVHVRNQEFWVRDLGSTNGTRINGEPVIGNEWKQVPVNANVSFGAVSMRVAYNAAGAAVGGPVGAALQTGLRLADLRGMAARSDLESKESYLSSIHGAQNVLVQHSGIVDLPKGVPTLVLSDIHARRDFLVKAMEHQVDGKNVLDLLKEGKINVVCIGDGMHAEGRAAARWEQAEQDMLHGRPSAALNAEMVEGLGTMKMIMDLKQECPENFHFVRGNHDEVKGRFAKYARVLGESAIVAEWMTKNYGAEFLDEYARFEESLPLLVRGTGFVASHAAPGGNLDREMIENRDPKAFAQLAWTENRQWDDKDPKVQEKFERNLAEVGGSGGRWLVGHRVVDDGLVRSQFGGQLLQINAPDDFVVALVPADGNIVPGRDVFSLK
jgi:pSer/pThr/pTyr-binding forkhead associated (FHA) protein